MYNRLIRESRAPARVRGALDRLMATGAPLPLVDEESLRRFVRVVESSRFAVDVLRAHERAWDILVQGDYPATHRPSLESAAGIREHYALSLFHVLVVDVLELVPFERTMELLTHASEECVVAAMAVAWRELVERFGAPAGLGAGETGYCVLGMGKLGGAELNFSSDIDLICFYAEDGETTGGVRGALAHMEWYARLTERIVDTLSARVHGPFGLKVDLRLRPEGKTGPLVRSLEAMMRYYEGEGTTWERQALIKARGVAGDAGLAQAFLDAVSPFIYHRYLDRDAIYAVEAIKGRIEAQAREHGRRHVKLSRGGIREIEFITQLLQLSNGGRCAAVRGPSTLRALDALVEHRYLLPADRDRLRSAYLFLRRVEHRLQMLDGRQTHVLPEDDGDVADLALRLDYASAAEFWTEYLAVTDGVRALYESRFARSREVSVTAIETEIITLLEDPDQEGGVPGTPRSAIAPPTWRDSLSEEAIGELRRLSRGSIADPQTATIRRLFIQSTPSWLPALLELPDPDRGLKRFARMVESYGAKSSLYEILAAYPAVAELLVAIAALSDPLSDLICRDPSTLEALLSPGGVTGGRDVAALGERVTELVKYAPSRDRALLMLKAEEHLRIGVRFLMGLADATRTGRELAALAELLVGADSEFVVIALGRFGAGDLGLTSDLDLVFVAATGDDGVTQAVQRRIAAWTKLGLKIDSRLRPMGRTAPLVGDVDAFEEYVTGTAETWERVAWARARVLSGPADARSRVERILEKWRTRPFGVEEVRAMAAMRRRLGDESRPEDMKRGPGGFIDLDLIAAMRMLRSGGSSVEPEVVFGDEPHLLRAHRFFRAWDASAQFAFGRAWRPEETAVDRARHALLLSRQGCDPADLTAIRSAVADAWDREISGS